MAHEAGGGADGGSQLLDGVDTHKTHNQLLQFKEQKLAREALCERRAQQLTKRYLKSSEEAAQGKREYEANLSANDYDKSMQKLRDASRAEALVTQMSREERSQIFEFMQDKDQQRRDDEARKEAEKLDRLKWVKARCCYEKLQAERRQNDADEEKKKRLDAMRDKQKHHDDAVKALLDGKSEAEGLRQQKVKDELLKVNEKRRKCLSDSRNEAKERANSHERRRLEAERRRDERNEQNAETIRAASRKRAQMVAEKMQQTALEQEMKAEQIAERMRQHDERSRRNEHGRRAQDESRQSRGTRCATVPGGGGGGGGGAAGWNGGGTGVVAGGGGGAAGVAGGGGGGAQSSSQQPQDSPKHVNLAGGSMDRPPGMRPAVSSWSKELTDANTSSKKDYVLKTDELSQLKSDMLANKKFKALADPALGVDAKHEDIQTGRMRALHNMFIAQKKQQKAGAGAGDKEAEGAASGESGKSASPPRSRTHLPSQRKPLTRRCGFCERDFPVDTLTGSAPRRMVERLRHQCPNLPGRGQPHNAKNGGASTARGRLEATPGGGNAGGASEALHSLSAGAGLGDGRGERPPDSLYDYDVKLCLACHHFIRISAA